MGPFVLFGFDLSVVENYTKDAKINDKNSNLVHPLNPEHDAGDQLYYQHIKLLYRLTSQAPPTQASSCEAVV